MANFLLQRKVAVREKCIVSRMIARLCNLLSILRQLIFNTKLTQRDLNTFKYISVNMRAVVVMQFVEHYHWHKLCMLKRNQVLLIKPSCRTSPWTSIELNDLIWDIYIQLWSHKNSKDNNKVWNTCANAVNVYVWAIPHRGFCNHHFLVGHMKQITRHV